MIGTPLQIAAVIAQLLVFVIAAFYAARLNKTLLLFSFILPTLIFSWHSFVFLAAMLLSILGSSTFSIVEPFLLIAVTVVIPSGFSYALLHGL
jgi:hypothetical protein